VIEVGGDEKVPFVSLKIEALTTDHAGGSGGCGQSAHKLGPDACILVRLRHRQQGKGQRAQGIAG